jgi:hypothetical protein
MEELTQCSLFTIGEDETLVPLMKILQTASFLKVNSEQGYDFIIIIITMIN